MSETLKVLETRRSCRAFKPELIEEEKLQAIIKAGTYAATGMGRQSPIIIVVTNKELRDKLSVMNAKFMGKDESFDPFYGAQELLIVLANKAMPTYLYDGTLVMGNLMNAAADLGVDSCWIHRAKEEFETLEGKEFLKSLGIEGDYEGIGHLVLGYAMAPLKRQRRERRITSTMSDKEEKTSMDYLFAPMEGITGYVFRSHPPAFSWYKNVLHAVYFTEPDAEIYPKGIE